MQELRVVHRKTASDYAIGVIAPIMGHAQRTRAESGLFVNRHLNMVKKGGTPASNT